MSNPGDRDLWIVVEGWDTFQHYRKRNPIWIKTYTDLMRRDEYLQLTGHRRAILHGLWLEYALTSSRLRVDTKSLGRRLNLVVKDADLLSLNQAGFITFSASAPLAPAYQNASPETETEKEPPSPPSERPKTTTPKTTPKTKHRCPECQNDYDSPRRLREHLQSIHFLREHEALELAPDHDEGPAS